jgi:hypothetical protein
LASFAPRAIPLWPCWVLGLVAVVSGGLCLGLGIDPGWAVIGTSFAGIPLIVWVELRQPRSVRTEPRQPVELDEEFVRRLEALAAEMREELEARRAGTPG